MGITISLRTVMFTPQMTQAESEAYLDIQLAALVAMDLLWLQNHPSTPRLHESGVRYRHEQIADEWMDVGAALHDKICDCKGLAAWRVAELRFSGEDPDACCSHKYAVVDDPTVGKLLLYHIQVTRGDGTIEDPSRELGMNVPEVDGYVPVPGAAWTIVNLMTNTVGAAMLGNVEARRKLNELRVRANAGDRRAYYLRAVARDIVTRGYDPRKTKFVRHNDGSFEWVYPDGLVSHGGSRGSK